MCQPLTAGKERELTCSWLVLLSGGCPLLQSMSTWLLYVNRLSGGYHQVGDGFLRLVLQEKRPRLETFVLLNLFLHINISFILTIVHHKFGCSLFAEGPANHKRSKITGKHQISALLLLALSDR